MRGSQAVVSNGTASAVSDSSLIATALHPSTVFALKVVTTVFAGWAIKVCHAD